MPDTTPHDDTGRWDVEALERLRRANPVPTSEVAALADSARAHAVREEITMQEHTQERSRDHTTEPLDHDATLGGGLRRLGPRLALAAAAVAVVIAGVVGVVLSGDGARDTAPIAEEPGTDPDAGVVPPMSAMCVEAYTLENLQNREFAFAGTLTAIDGDDLTFEVEEVFKGEVGDRITLGGAGSLAAMTSENDAPVAVGDQLLVSGTDGFAWGCGFTLPYDQDTAERWRDTLG